MSQSGAWGNECRPSSAAPEQGYWSWWSKTDWKQSPFSAEAAPTESACSSTSLVVANHISTAPQQTNLKTEDNAWEHASWSTWGTWHKPSSWTYTSEESIQGITSEGSIQGNINDIQMAVNKTPLESNSYRDKVDSDSYRDNSGRSTACNMPVDPNHGGNYVPHESNTLQTGLSSEASRPWGSWWQSNWWAPQQRPASTDQSSISASSLSNGVSTSGDHPQLQTPETQHQWNSWSWQNGSSWQNGYSWASQKISTEASSVRSSHTQEGSSYQWPAASPDFGSLTKPNHVANGGFASIQTAVSQSRDADSPDNPASPLAIPHANASQMNAPLLPEATKATAINSRGWSREEDGHENKFKVDQSLLAQDVRVNGGNAHDNRANGHSKEVPSKELDPWRQKDPWRKAAEQAHNGVLPGAPSSQAAGRTENVEGSTSRTSCGTSNNAPPTPSPSATVVNDQSISNTDDEPKKDLWSSFKATSSPLSSPLSYNRADQRASSFSHLGPQRYAVMQNEVVEALMATGGSDASYVDCTFGRGGHSQEILRRLSSDGKLIAFDLDPMAYRAGQALERQDSRFKIHHRPHGDLADVIEPGTNLAGILLDLGTSPVGYDDRRGFSDRDDGPLDLRLNSLLGMPAWQWLQTVSVAELAWVIHTYGEDNDPVLSQRLAEAILERQRRAGAYTSMLQLADVCRETKQGLDDRGMHPAKLTFQAIRAFLNHEADQFQRALLNGMVRLKPQGRIVVITYKRREATQVKQFLRTHEEPDPRFETMVSPSRLGELYPLCSTDLPFKCIQAQEPMKASPEESANNKNSRTALVHVLLKESRDVSSSPSKGTQPRPQHEQWKRPSPLPFMGAVAPA